MSKKTKRNLYQSSNSSDLDYLKGIKIAIGVIVVLVLTYLVTATLTGEIKWGSHKNKAVKEETSIQYEEIIAGEVLNRVQDEYYVLLFNFTDTFASYYLSLKDSYTNKEKSLAMYIVDLEKEINKTIVLEGDSYSERVDVVSDLKVASPTLIKVRNHQVVERINGRNDILNFFDSMK